MKRIALIAIVLVSTAAVLFAFESSPTVVFNVRPDPLPIGTAATLTLMNDTAETLTLTSSAPWSIYDESGAAVYAPIHPSAEDPLAPGERREWTWNQTRDDGQPIEPGEYEARLIYRAESGDIVTVPAPFEITPQ